MTIQISSSGHNIKRLRSDAKKLAKTEKIKLHEAQDRIAEQAGEGAWDSMVHDSWMLHACSGFVGEDLNDCGWGELAQRSPRFLGLYRESGWVAPYPYYDVIDMTELFDQLVEMDSDEVDGAASFAMRRQITDAVDLGRADEVAVFNRFRLELGENEDMLWGELDDQGIEAVKAVIAAQSLVKLAQFAVARYSEAVGDAGYAGWMDSDDFDVDGDLRFEEWLAENRLTQDDAVFAPMVSLGGWSAEVFKVKDRYAVVPTNDNSKDWAVAWLTADRWDDVWDTITDRCASPVADAASLEVLQEVLSGEYT